MLRTTLQVIAESDRLSEWSDLRAQQGTVALILGSGLGVAGWLVLLVARDWVGFWSLLMGGGLFIWLGTALAQRSVEIMREAVAVLEEETRPGGDGLDVLRAYLERLRAHEPD